MSSKRYSHLEKIIPVEYDWKTNMMKKALPPRAFYNVLTSNIIMSVQLILVKGFETADSIRQYLKF